MEVDTSEQILNWVVVRLDDIKSLLEEFFCEGPTIFEDDSIILHPSYRKETQIFSCSMLELKGIELLLKRNWKIKKKNANPSDVIDIHRETGEDISHTMDD